MSTTSLSLRYRPLRIGFLVQQGNVEDLVVAANLNTTIIGGMYNPIIPLGEADLTKTLLELFNVDCVHAVSKGSLIKAFFDQYHDLQYSPQNAKNFFTGRFDSDEHPSYVDVFHTINNLWLNGFKDKGDDFIGSARLFEWDSSDQLSTLFHLWLGKFPAKYDISEQFIKGLRGRKEFLAVDATISLSTLVTEETSSDEAKRSWATSTPLSFTTANLLASDIEFGGNGFVVGDASNFDHLMTFWNLRAAGKTLLFIPYEQQARMHDVIKKFLPNLLSLMPGFINVKDHIYVYHFESQVSAEQARAVMEGFDLRRKIITLSCDNFLWNNPSISPSPFHLSPYDLGTLANVEPTTDGYEIAVNLPEKRFVNNEVARVRTSQLVGLSVRPIEESSYPGHTLHLPYLPALNHAESLRDPHFPLGTCCEEKGMGVVVDTVRNNLHLSPISHPKLIEMIFALAKINIKISPPGRLAMRIIEQLGGWEEAEILRMPGVRKLLQATSQEKGINRSQATNYINDNGSIDKFRGYRFDCEDGEKKFFTFDRLVERNMYRPGLEVPCNHCGLENWLPLRVLDDHWICVYCGHENQTSVALHKHKEWMYRKSGLFAPRNNQEGAIPVLLTMMCLRHLCGDESTILSTAMKLTIASKECETDLCIIEQRQGKVSVGIGECKSEGSFIDSHDTENLKRVWTELKSKGITCYLIFSKPAERFAEDELALFSKLVSQSIPVVLFTQKELEAFRPYYANDSLPARHPSSLSDAALNSQHLYLSNKQKDSANQ